MTHSPVVDTRRKLTVNWTGEHTIDVSLPEGVTVLGSGIFGGNPTRENGVRLRFKVSTPSPEGSYAALVEALGNIALACGEDSRSITSTTSDFSRFPASDSAVGGLPHE